MLKSNLQIPISPILTAIEGLVFHWDFTGDEPMRSKGRYFANLHHQKDQPEFIPLGVVSSSSLIIRDSQTMKIKLKDYSEIELAAPNSELTVLGWIKVPRVNGRHDKGLVKLDWCFVCKVISRNGESTVLNFLADDYQKYSPFHLINNGSSIWDGEILINIQSIFQEDDPIILSFLSGLTLYNRALTKHEIYLIYHHM